MAILFILVAFVAAAVTYAWHHSKYWARRGIDGPPTLPFFGNLRQLGLSNDVPWPFAYKKWSKQYGRYYGIQKGHRNCLIISDPKMAHEVMNTQFDLFHERDLPPLDGNPESDPYAHLFLARGHNWRRLRALSSPITSANAIKRVLPTVHYCADETMRLLDEKAASGETFNVARNIHEFTLDVIARIALGHGDTRQFQNPLSATLRKAMHDIEDFWFRTSWMFPFLGQVFKYIRLLIGAIRSYEFVKVIKHVERTIEERKAKRAKGGDADQSDDFIDLFLAAESNEIDRQGGSTFDRSNTNVQKKLTNQEVVGQCILFLFAGFDTTANTLAFTLWYLAKHTPIQDKLREEAEQVCTSASPSYEELQKLKYSDAVMKEVLRLHPIASIITSRKCGQDMKLGGEVPIEKGTNVILDVLTLHMLPSIWGDDAEEFRPERWQGEDAPTLMSAFYGFGGGPRICAGMRLAYVEQKLLLTQILRRWRVCETPSTGHSMHITGFVTHPDAVNVRLAPLD